jgi:hypothetical protein
MPTAKKNSKRSTSKKAASKKPRRFFREVIKRTLVLMALVALVVTVGHYKYGWEPFGDKSAHRVAKDTGASKTQKPGLDGKLQAIIQKVKTEVQEGLGMSEGENPIPTSADDPGKNVETAEKKDSGDKNDEDKLKEFLESQF